MNWRDIDLRWLVRRELSQCIAIERLCFENPWTEEDFLCCLRQRNCIGYVASIGANVYGYMIYELHHARLHILNFAVDPCAQRNGIGRRMVDRLIDKLAPHRRNEMLLEIRERNVGNCSFGNWGSEQSACCGTTTTTRTRIHHAISPRLSLDEAEHIRIV